MTGVILAGGENRRIPVLKGHLEINGQRIIEVNLTLLRNTLGKAAISTNMPEHFFYCGAPMIGDVIKKRGPLTGIFSALLNTGDDILAVACDMPFISEKLIRHMIEEYSTGRRWDAAVLVFEGKPQPLPGIYSKDIIPAIEDRLDKDRRGLREMLADSDVLYIKEDDVRSMDPEGRSFVNINTMEEYKKVVSASA